MASLRYSPSDSVAAIDQSFGDEPVTAAQVVNELLRMHPHYGKHLAARVQIPDSFREIAPAAAWIAQAARPFHFERSSEMHGRLLLLGLAISVESVRQDLIRTGLLQAVAAETRLPELLTPEARKEWSRIEALWNPQVAEPQSAAEPVQKAPLAPHPTTRRPIPGPKPGSTPPPHEHEAPQSGAVELSQKQPRDHLADAPSRSVGSGRAVLSGHGPDDQPTLVSQVQTGGPAEVVQNTIDAVRGEETDPEAPAPSGGEAAAQATAAPTDQETVPAHPDDPAVLDTLARRPFARCIADRMDEVWKGRENRPTVRGAADTGSGGAFMLHLHGPWGSGKSSILNFLRDELQGQQRRPDERWVVVEFNAWRHQRIRPPWWALIRDVYAQSARQLSPLQALWLRVRWWAWRVRADWLPVAGAAVIITLAVLVITGVIDPFPEPAQTAPGTQAQRQADEAWKGVEFALKLLTAALAAWGALFAVSRSLAFGSARAAQTYTELKSDPLGPIVRLFQRLTDRVGRPVAVFIDDLDRCDGKYVVELLEGIQTLFRTAPVTYVVAADRKWICASFQQGYKDFGEDIGEAGRPLGYLFLDKLFQVSASVPRPAPGVQRAYWGALLRAAGTADAVALEDQRRQAEEKAARQIGDRHTTEALQAFVAAAPNKVEEEGRRAVAAQRITTAQAQHETQKHLLEGFADLLEPNPRSMKRLVNAYGLHQATHFLEHRSVPPHALARWTIMELRWPLLADHMASHPESVTAIRKGTVPEGLPETLEPLFRDPEVRAVAGMGDEGLDEAALRQIVGSVDASPARQPAPPGKAPSAMPAEEAAPAATAAPS
jgi:hypothetical protein